MTALDEVVDMLGARRGKTTGCEMVGRRISVDFMVMLTAFSLLPLPPYFPHIFHSFFFTSSLPLSALPQVIPMEHQVINATSLATLIYLAYKFGGEYPISS